MAHLAVGTARKVSGFWSYLAEVLWTAHESFRKCLSTFRALWNGTTTALLLLGTEGMGCISMRSILHDNRRFTATDSEPSMEFRVYAWHRSTQPSKIVDIAPRTC